MPHLDDAVGAQVTALLGRGLPRDYLDVAAVLDRFSRRGCSSRPSRATQDLRVTDVALAMRRLGRLNDMPFQQSPLRPQEVTAGTAAPSVIAPSADSVPIEAARSSRIPRDDATRPPVVR